jgi:hypothetical protein
MPQVAQKRNFGKKGLSAICGIFAVCLTMSSRGIFVKIAQIALNLGPNDKKRTQRTITWKKNGFISKDC